ncbi:hypothetical protein K438DRAFT_1988938 [Mycena galopus ATCC 62051]|nr:hypothetical protein K438DRAFT_1988938 [Mycena galopus ATCC 62051]
MDPRHQTVERTKIHCNSLRFIEDKNGDVALDDKNACHGWCYKFFFGLQTEGRAPDSWGKASLALTSEFRTAAESEFPNLRLCHLHWKADQLASILYAAWHSTHASKGGKVKQEAVDIALSDDETLSGDDNEIQVAPAPSTKKRSHAEAGPSAGVVFKRAKTVDVTVKKKVANPLLGKTPKPVRALTAAGSSSDMTTTSFIPAPSQSTPTSTPIVHPVSLSIVVDPVPKASPSQVTDVLFSPNDAGLASLQPTAPPSFDAVPSLMSIPALTTAFTAAITPAITVAIPALSPPSHDPVLQTPVAATINPGPTITTMPAVPGPTGLPPPAPVLPPAPSSTTLAPTNPIPTTRKKKWNPDRNSITPRGLCALDYHKKHPQMELADFDGYWRTLPDPDKQAWKTCSENAKVARQAAM